MQSLKLFVNCNSCILLFFQGKLDNTNVNITGLTEYGEMDGMWKVFSIYRRFNKNI